MPAITRQGDSDTGHDKCPGTSLTSGSPNVLINGKCAGRVGDTYAPHGCDEHPPHVGAIASGAAHVFINGLAAGRVGDAVSCGGTVAGGSTDVGVGNGGGSSLIVNGRTVSATDFKNKCVTEAISRSPLYNDYDEIILATPDICRNMAAKSKGYESESWEELSRLLNIWLTGNEYIVTNAYVENGAAPIENLALDWNWYLSFQRTRNKYEELVGGALSQAGRELLIKRLQKFPSYNQRQDFDFDFSKFPPNEWQQWYINSKKVEKSPEYGVDGINIVLSSHMLKVLPSGAIHFSSDGSKTIIVNKLFVYIQDLFNFEDDFLFDTLGLWSKKEKDFKHIDIILNPLNFVLYYNLTNTKFNEFREKYGRGQDFILHSELRECPEFIPWSYTVE
jgi:uncharacterized Zn-binding protein involved in type VI secretion